jgi:hypothetical protein
MHKKLIVRTLAAALLGSTLLLPTAPMAAQGPEARSESMRPGRGAPLTEAERAQMLERMQARMNQRLDRLAARLEIKASQQEAWSTYRAAVQSTFQNRPARPAPDADAATLLRFRADMAQRRAQHLGTVADATAKLQQALDPNQRKVLDELARSHGGRGKHRGPGHRHRHHGGERGGQA